VQTIKRLSKQLAKAKTIIGQFVTLSSEIT
jgi:hypothetical protein